MSYKLKSINGEVEVVKKAGSAYVKFAMPEGKAKGIIETGVVKLSDKFPGFGLCVDDEYYFAGELSEEKSSDSNEKPADDPKPERKDFGNKFHKKKH